MSKPQKLSDVVSKAKTVELSEHLDPEQWQTWPTQNDVHLRWGVRERQITSCIRTGKLTLYRCPDNLLRLDPKQVSSIYGPEGLYQGRDRQLPAQGAPSKKELAAMKAEQQEQLQEAVADPLAMCFKEVCVMLRDMRQQQKETFELIVTPLKELNKQQTDLTGRLLTRVSELEQRERDTAMLNIELADMKAIRDLQVSSEQAKQRRRDASLDLLKEWLPKIAEAAAGKASLAAFVKGLKPEVREQLQTFAGLLIESGELSAEQAVMLRVALQVKNAPAGANGAGAHDESTS